MTSGMSGIWRSQRSRIRAASSGSSEMRTARTSSAIERPTLTAWTTARLMPGTGTTTRSSRRGPGRTASALPFFTGMVLEMDLPKELARRAEVREIVCACVLLVVDGQQVLTVSRLPDRSSYGITSTDETLVRLGLEYWDSPRCCVAC